MSYWQRLGGPNAITIQAWLVLAPISIFLTFAFVPEGARGEYPMWMLVGLLAHLATGAVLLIAKLSFLSARPRKPRPISAVITFAIAGIARGATVSFTTEALGLVEQAEYLLRMRSGAVLVVFWFGFSAIMIDASKRYRSSYLELQQKLQEYQALEKSSATAVQSFRERIVQEVEAIMANAFGKESGSEALKDVVNKVISPLSRELYLKEQYPAIQQQITRGLSQSRRVSFRSTLFTMFSKTAFNPGLVVILSLGGTAASRLWTSPLLSFALDLLLNSVWIYLIFLSAKSLTRDRPVFRTLIAVPVWSLTGIGSGLITDFVRDFQLDEGPSGAFLLATNLIAAAIFASALSAYDLQRDEKLHELKALVTRAQWLRSRTKQALWCERRRLARIIHSEVQSRLLATATRLSRLGESRTLSSSELDQLRTDCHYAMLAAERIEPIAAFLKETKEVWEGAIEIDLPNSDLLSENLAIDSAASLAALEVIREAVNNAAKHAEPKRIRISASIDPTLDPNATFLNLQVTNDGVKKQEQSGLGLGSQILNEVSPDWNFEITEDVATLTARIPLRLSVS